MSESALMEMKTSGGVSIARISAMLDFSLEKTSASLLSLTKKGIVTGYVNGEPCEIISLTEKGDVLLDGMCNENDT